MATKIVAPVEVPVSPMSETGMTGSETVIEILNTEVGAVDVLASLVGLVQIEIVQHTLRADRCSRTNIKN